MNVHNVDPWKHILKALEPKIEVLAVMLDHGPKIYPDITQRGRNWEIRLQEGWDTELDFQPLIGGDKLGEAVNWTTEQLENWQGVKRMSYDIWQFKRKKDAEKFQTLFNLKWAG